MGGRGECGGGGRRGPAEGQEPRRHKVDVATLDQPAAVGHERIVEIPNTRHRPADGGQAEGEKGE